MPAVHPTACSVFSATVFSATTCCTTTTSFSIGNRGWTSRQRWWYTAHSSIPSPSSTPSSSSIPSPSPSSIPTVLLFQHHHRMPPTRRHLCHRIQPHHQPVPFPLYQPAHRHPFLGQPHLQRLWRGYHYFTTTATTTSTTTTTTTTTTTDGPAFVVPPPKQPTPGIHGVTHKTTGEYSGHLKIGQSFHDFGGRHGWQSRQRWTAVPG